MAQRRYYRVAEHVFSIEAPEEMLVQLTSYEPFRIWDKPHEVRFDLTIGISPLAVEDREHVFTDVSDDDMPRIEVYRVKQNWLFCIAMSKEGPVCSRLLTTADFRQAWLEIDTQYASFAINNAAMLLYAFSTAHLSTLEMHAAVAVRKGKGYLFLGRDIDPVIGFIRVLCALFNRRRCKSRLGQIYGCLPLGLLKVCLLLFCDLGSLFQYVL